MSSHIFKDLTQLTVNCNVYLFLPWYCSACLHNQVCAVISSHYEHHLMDLAWVCSMTGGVAVRSPVACSIQCGQPAEAGAAWLVRGDSLLAGHPSNAIEDKEPVLSYYASRWQCCSTAVLGTTALNSGRTPQPSAMRTMMSTKLLLSYQRKSSRIQVAILRRGLGHLCM